LGFVKAKVTSSVKPLVRSIAKAPKLRKAEFVLMKLKFEVLIIGAVPV
jgi:hypothetical protein